MKKVCSKCGNNFKVIVVSTPEYYLGICTNCLKDSRRCDSVGKRAKCEWLCGEEDGKNDLTKCENCGLFVCADCWDEHIEQTCSYPGSLKD